MNCETRSRSRGWIDSTRTARDPSAVTRWTRSSAEPIAREAGLDPADERAADAQVDRAPLAPVALRDHGAEGVRQGRRDAHGGAPLVRRGPCDRLVDDLRSGHRRDVLDEVHATRVQPAALGRDGDKESADRPRTLAPQRGGQPVQGADRDWGRAQLQRVGAADRSQHVHDDPTEAVHAQHGRGRDEAGLLFAGAQEHV
jgi:hypothetical protein